MLASIGYWGGAPRGARRFSAGSYAGLSATTDHLAGDPRLLRAGARIGVRSFYRAPQHRHRDVSLAVDVLYATGEGSVPFHAWSYERHGATPAKAAQRSTFTAPVDALATLDFVIHRGSEQQRISFSSNTNEGVGLRPGVYFLALHEIGDPTAIDWSRISIREGLTPGGVHPDGVLTMTSLGAETPVPFSYLVIAVESAG
ncbi:MAG TPA: hypothetical protein VFO55_02290 [Gemmatimonadaceae bacterium]|nr:hypothetical protein [Gemmatimonadaceae bacterium]